jgi:endonuclease/exonuclease/phosphatase family metal-dependent hydrolase
MQTLHVVTFNIHKGFSQFKRRLTVHELREKLHAIGPDLVFLQEVQGLHARHATEHRDWPALPQHEFLADDLWTEYAYGRNTVHDQGHHGNAILSKFPIVRWDNEDVSMSRLERRGLLHCEIEIPGWSHRVHCLNVHLGLFATWRHRQIDRLVGRIQRLVPADAPLVIAGDFNDWTRTAGRNLARALGVTEVFEQAHGVPARSYPARMPVLHLDRIYVRGFHVKLAHVHRGRRFASLSDHAALSALLQRH